MKKLLSFVLAVIMLLSLMAGCTNTPAPDGTSGNTQSDPTDGSQAPKEMRTVKILCIRNKQAASYPQMDFDKWEENETYRVAIAALEQRGIKLDIEVIDNEQYNDAVKPRLIAGVDLPDIILDPGLSETEAISLGEAGMVADVLSLLETYDADGSILAYMDEVAGSAVSRIITEDNKLYWFPYVYGRTFVDKNGNELENVMGSGATTVSIRKDWLDVIGVDYKYTYTPDELYDILVAFRDKDANGNGVADEVIHNFSSGAFKTGFEPAFGLGYYTPVTVRNDGKGVICNVTSAGFADYIRFLQRLYQAGVIDTTILNGTDMLGTNRASTLRGYAAQDWLEESVIGFEDTALYVPFVLDDDDGANGFAVPRFDNKQNTLTRWFINAESKNLQAVVDLMDYVYTEEFAHLAAYGIEGVTYTVTDKGYYTFLPGHPNYEEGSTAFPLENTLSLNALPHIIHEVMDRETCLSLETDNPYYVDKVNFVGWLWDNADKITYSTSTLPYATATADELDTINQYESQITTYINELVMDLVIGQKSLDDMGQYLTELEGLSLSKYVAVFEARYERYLDNMAAMAG